jgi:hypothetical protein
MGTLTPHTVRDKVHDRVERDADQLGRSGSAQSQIADRRDEGATSSAFPTLSWTSSEIVFSTREVG